MILVPIRRSSLRVLGVALLAAACWSAGAAAVEVRFQVNDAQEKDRAVPGVRIVAAPADGRAEAVETESDESGGATLELEPGSWVVTYRRPGYVTIAESPLEVEEAGRLVTTTLSRMLEAEGGDVTRRVRFVLNWGSDESQAVDLDAHGTCACSDEHVFFGAATHERDGHRMELDVDDRDWGGPETITMVDPPPGTYRFWVHDFVGDREPIGSSDVVVRLYFDDLLVTELVPPADLDGREWRPFDAVVVEPDLRPRLVRHDDAQLADGADRRPPPGQSSPSGGGSPAGGGSPIGGDAAPGGFVGLGTCLAIFGLLVVAVVLLVRKAARARAR